MIRDLSALKLQEGEEKRLREKIAARPDDIAAWRRLARLLGQRKRATEALAVLDLALRDLPADRETKMLMARTAEEAREAKRAVALWKELAREFPSDILPYEKLERIFKERGEREKIARLFQSVPEGSPMRLRALKRLVSLHKDNGEPARALRFQAKLVKEGARDFAAVKELARLSERTGRLRAAVRFYREALALEPSNPDVLLAVGVCQRKAGQGAQARATFAELLRVKPGFYGGHIHLAEMAIEEDDLAEAESHLKRLDARWPGNSRVKINRAHILLKQGRPREALAIAREGVSESPFYYTDEVSRGHQVLSLVHAALKEKGEAECHDVLARRIQGSSDSFRASIGALEDAIARKSVRLAERIASELGRKHSGNSLFCLKLAELARLKGEWAAAESYAEKASREPNPRYVRDKVAALRFLEKLYASRGNREKALACRAAAARALPGS